MLFIGWILGYWAQDLTSGFDHWIAFGLLSFVGGKMIFESFKASEEKIPIPKSAEAIWPFHPLPYGPRHSME